MWGKWQVSRAGLQVTSQMARLSALGVRHQAPPDEAQELLNHSIWPQIHSFVESQGKEISVVSPGSSENTPISWEVKFQPCGWQGLGALAGCQAWDSEVGEPSLRHWSTRDLPAPHNINWRSSPRDLHLNPKTQLHSTTSKLQCWAPYAKQLARQTHNPNH